MIPAHFSMLAHTVFCEALKGGIPLASTGYIQVSAYTSRARIPLEGVAVMITHPDGSAIAMRLTDRSGKIAPVPITVPDKASSQTPDTGIVPYTSVNIYARLENFEQIEAENVQVFPGTITNQNLEMIPLSELPSAWSKAEIFNTPPQNL